MRTWFWLTCRQEVLVTEVHQALSPSSVAGRTQVQSLPGALPAQLVRPEEGKVTWILDADAASAIGAEKWVEKSKDFPRSTPS